MKLKDRKLFRQKCYVDGAWIGADDGKTFRVNNPVDDSTLGSAPSLGKAETRRAINAAGSSPAAISVRSSRNSVASIILLMKTPVPSTTRPSPFHSPPEMR